MSSVIINAKNLIIIFLLSAASRRAFNIDFFIRVYTRYFWCVFVCVYMFVRIVIIIIFICDDDYILSG